MKAVPNTGRIRLRIGTNRIGAMSSPATNTVPPFARLSARASSGVR